MENTTKTILSMENRQTLTMSGIRKVKTTEPTSVVAVLDNCLVVINGTNLSVENLSVKEGTIELAGQINGIRYTNSHKNKFSFKNMFK